MTTIGLLSDTHGRADTARDAVGLLLEHGADLLVHLGDIGNTAVIDALAVQCLDNSHQIESHIVFGNCDWDAKPLAAYARDLGVVVHDPAGVLMIDGKRIIFTHGHDQAAMSHAIENKADFLLHGHTHLQSDNMIEETRVINPGALFRASRHTVAVLTPASGDLAVLEVAGVVR